MVDVDTIYVNNLFPKLNNELTTLLKDLSDTQWQGETGCKDWCVKDIAQHLLGDYIGVLSRKRDQYKPEVIGPSVDTWLDRVEFINEINRQWVDATKRLSPRLLIELLEYTGGLLGGHFNTVYLQKVESGVSWISDERLPNWMDVAREYTEHWLHQAHIREAVGEPLLLQSELYHPFIATYMLAVPKTYANVEANPGVTVRIVVVGDAGGEWLLQRQDSDWVLTEVPCKDVDARVEIPQDILWKLFSKGMRKEEAQGKVHISGDKKLGEVTLNTVSLIA